MWGEIEGGRVIQFLGGDNANSYSWIRNGKPRQGISMNMMAGFKLRISHYGLEPIPFLLSTHQDVAGDFSTRASTGQITNLEETRNITRVTILRRRVQFRAMANLFTRECQLPERTR